MMILKTYFFRHPDSFRLSSSLGRVIHICIAVTLLVFSSRFAYGEEFILGRWTFNQDNIRNGKVMDQGRFHQDGTLLGKFRSFHYPGGEEGIVLDGRTNSILLYNDDAIGNAHLPQNGMTVEAWVLCLNPERWGGIIGVFQDNSSHEKGWVLGYNEKSFSFGLAGRESDDGDGNMTYLESKSEFKLRRWYHVVGVYDGIKTMRLYVNGKLEGESHAQSGSILYPDKAFYEIGAYHDKDEYFRLNGKLVEASVYDQPFSRQEVLEKFRKHQQLVTSGKEFFEGPEFVQALEEEGIRVEKLEKGLWEQYERSRNDWDKLQKLGYLVYVLRGRYRNRDGDEIAKEGERRIQEIRKQILTQDEETRLIGIAFLPGSSKEDQEEARKRLNENLILIRELHFTRDYFYLQHRLRLLSRWIRSSEDIIRPVRDPAFKTRTYPAVRDDPMRFIMQILRFRSAY